MIARMYPATEDLPEILPTKFSEDLISEGIEQDPIIQVVTHIAASRYSNPVHREIISPLFDQIYKLAETLGPVGEEIIRKLGVADDAVVTLAYSIVPDIVTIIAAGFDADSTALPIEEMVQAPLRKAGWTRKGLEALIQRRFSSGTEERIQKALPSFSVDKLTLHELSTEPDKP